ncbi:MAG: GNAT family N-acetyltransferase [Clostridia bacterium]|nr:GNAT family N-acetyltransferase [Clostridia bacterium]
MSYFEERNNPVLHCCATEPLRLGRAHILRETNGGALVREDAAGMYILAADSFADAQELLRDVDGVSFIMLCNADFSPLIERYGLDNRMVFRQAAYLRRELPPEDPRLRIEVAGGRSLARILEVYHLNGPESIREQARRGELFFATDAQGAEVGFVGLHPEGCFGMLEVFPEQRGKGYGAALERHILRFCRETGRLPYCQVEEDNLVSMKLQRKLGLEISPETLLMAWGREH